MQLSNVYPFWCMVKILMDADVLCIIRCLDGNTRDRLDVFIVN